MKTEIKKKSSLPLEGTADKDVRAAKAAEAKEAGADDKARESGGGRVFEQRAASGEQMTIEVRNLVKTYKKRNVVNGVSLHMQTGEIVMSGKCSDLLNDEGIKALVEALTSDEIRQYINDTYDGAVIPFTE